MSITFLGPKKYPKVHLTEENIAGTWSAEQSAFAAEQLEVDSSWRLFFMSVMVEHILDENVDDGGYTDMEVLSIRLPKNHMLVGLAPVNVTATPVYGVVDFSSFSE